MSKPPILDVVQNGLGIWYVICDAGGFTTGIGRGGWTVLHLVAGAERNEEAAQAVVDELNALRTLRRIVAEAVKEIGGE